MDEEEQLAAINRAATVVKNELRDGIGNKIYVSSARPRSNVTEAVLQSIGIASFRLTDIEEGIINRKVDISLQLERAIDDSFVVFACHFSGDFGSINDIRKYAPIDKEPADSTNAYEPRKIWYTPGFLTEISQNPYVIELHQGHEETSWFSFYDEPNSGCDAIGIANFIKSVITNLPGFEELLCSDETTREQLILARVGQGDYRKGLEVKWDNKCSVLGIEIKELLRASHIKPWRLSDNKERRDPENGLLLSAHLDALFDRYLISFNDEGTMLVNNKIQKALRGKQDFIGGIRNDKGQITLNTKNYLGFHRGEFEKRST
jgi:hypothetical protein